MITALDEAKKNFNAKAHKLKLFAGYKKAIYNEKNEDLQDNNLSKALELCSN